MTREDSEETEDILDVLDLPRLYTCPPLATLLASLDLLATPPPSWDLSVPSSQKPTLHIVGNPGPWITSLISSPLNWLPDDTAREMVWETASLRLAERCGRAAMPDIDRSFKVAENVEIKIHEPSLDGDNLGLKTWGAAYVLGKRVAGDQVMKDMIRTALDSDKQQRHGTAKRILELGSGTGLVGLSLAATILTTLGGRMDGETAHVQVHLTDLPPILPNLQRNVEMNKRLIPAAVQITTEHLDWSTHASAELSGVTSKGAMNRYPLIIAADCLYSSEHPGLLSGAVSGWLQKSKDARFIIEIPLRKLFGEVRVDFKRLMVGKGFVIIEEGEEDAMDDWGDGGELMKCWWVVYGWAGALCEGGEGS
ncbi:hypothetical protein H072_6111 [Dactylellina haptotyla CBS 200.50]|uniref:Uncharacterized protein n=1 Tax=Dactylellina haptotyla (strain CBS 200.50) TaxID=1284197 RepID=S8AFZ9_DACHA|nr:hypothetical protein H072_6111 [Dactylellina haptotyla CBS 200.50]